MTEQVQDQSITVGSFVDYTTAKGNVHMQLKVLEIKQREDGSERVVIESKKGRPVEVDPTHLILSTEPPADKVKVPRAKREHTYDRAAINQAVKADAESGKTRLYPNRSRYQLGTSAAEDQRRTIDNGDKVADMLRDVPLIKLYETAAEHLGADRAKQLSEKYAHLNVGMQRMNVGNVLRGYFHQLENPKPVKAPKPPKSIKTTEVADPAATPAVESKSRAKRRKAQQGEGSPAEAKQAAPETTEPVTA